MAFQPLIRRGVRSNATARQLIVATQQPAPHVIAGTIEDARVTNIKPCKVIRDATLAGVHLRQGEHFFLVASKKFVGRCYIVIQRDAKWITSCKDARSAEAIIARVIANRLLRQVA